MYAVCLFVVVVVVVVVVWFSLFRFVFGGCFL